MYVAFYKGRGTILDWIIRAATRSPYSHVEIIDNYNGWGGRPIGYTSSPRDGGVVVREIPWRPEHWDVVFVPWTNGEKAMAFIREREGAGYDWLGILFTHALGIGWQSSRRWTCPELIGTVIGFERAWRMSPGDLHAALTFAIRKARVEELTAPPVVSDNPLENPLTASQFEAALILMGIDGDEIEPAIVATITDPVEQAKAIGGWRRLVSITRDNAIMSMLKPYFSVTDEQIDEAWTQAAGF